MSGMDDVLRRFHQVLVEEITAQRPEYLDGPFTVAEIYQNLAPYGSHRDRIGVEMNGDYEDALLRLLAGEGEYLVLESEHALRELREELDSSNPNTGVYREFAAVDVRLATTTVGAAPAEAADEGPAHDELSEAPDSGDGFWEEAHAVEGEMEETMSLADLAPTDDSEMPRMETEPLGADLGMPAASASPVSNPEAPSACPWCRADLPERENLNFCPFCGTDVHLVPCPGCGEELEPDWRFCISCGTEVTG